MGPWQLGPSYRCWGCEGPSAQLTAAQIEPTDSRSRTNELYLVPVARFVSAPPLDLGAGSACLQGHATPTGWLLPHEGFPWRNVGWLGCLISAGCLFNPLYRLSPVLSILSRRLVGGLSPPRFSRLFLARVFLCRFQVRSPC